MQARAVPSNFDFRREVSRMLRLAVPVVLAELGWMSMTIVDTIMVGHLGPAAIGATGIGSSAYYSFAIFGMGLLLGLDTLVSQSFGSGDREDCHHSLAQAVYLALLMTPLLMTLFAFMPPVFNAFGVNEQVSALAGPYLTMLSWSTLPLLLYGACRRYLQGVGHVRPVMLVLLTSNLVNWLGNWLLIDGHWGLPALGVPGSAMSTCFARLYMAATLAAFIWWLERGTAPGFASLIRKPDTKRIGLLLRIGFPAATQILLEIGAFGAAAILAGRLTPAALAAHQIALNCAALSYMVPLGISSAAAVAVGQAIGRRDPVSARRDGFIAIGLGCAFMLCAAITFLAAPGPILRVYTDDARVLTVGTGLLAIAALFQLFDGIQTVATGALRGIGNTRTPMLVNLGGYWLFGLPVGYLLCFQGKLGIYGLWIGLSMALIAIALFLMYSWQRNSRALAIDAATITLPPAAP
ncbi:MAG TPA: MATE family efflux transporter [Bryobacteraceae bacterium]|nr:MATE family efflux transporter [Bryobacteraceae bacterium]